VPNHHPLELNDLHQEDIAKLRANLVSAQAEIERCRQDAALVVHALNCAVQLIEMLIAFTPEGSTLHPGVATAKGALDHAMLALTGKRP
jgi:hypothetical protein